MKPISPYIVIRYQTKEGTIPYSSWLSGLDAKASATVEGRILRVEMGLLGDCKALGEGVFELRIDLGPGYRVYFGMINGKIVLLLCGGDKSTQNKKDIKQAAAYLKDYKERTNERKKS